MMRAGETEVLLEVKGLKKYFPLKKGPFSRKVDYVHAVDGLDFHIKRGETLGMVGESGCGKSTAGQLVVQLMKPTGGEVYFEGRNLTRSGPDIVRKMRRDLQIIFQDPFSSLNPRKKIRDIIAEPLKIHGLAKPGQIDEIVASLLEAVGMGSHHMHRYPHEFSGGQRQRIGIARALSLKPKLIVCDEPVSALDVSVQAQILNLLKKLQADYGLTYLFIAHGLPAVKHVSDRIAVMYLGKIVELASREELFARPRHPYTEALLSAVPVTDPNERRERIIVQGDMPSPANPPRGCRFHTRCPYARDICREREPVYEQLSEGHWVSCHFPL